MKVLLNSGNVKIKHPRTTSRGRLTGLVEEEMMWSEGMNYRIRRDGEEFLAELVRTEEHGHKLRLVFER